MTDKQLLEQVLEFMKANHSGGPDAYELMDAIRARLEQPEQEPVATDWKRIARVQDAKLRAMCNEPGAFEKLRELMDKYEAMRPTPPAAPVQEPVGYLYSWIHSSATGKPDETYTSFAETLEQATRHEAHFDIRPVYTTPPAAPVKEEIQRLRALVRAQQIAIEKLEEQLKEKNSD